MSKHADVLRAPVSGVTSVRRLPIARARPIALQLYSRTGRPVGFYNPRSQIYSAIYPELATSFGTFLRTLCHEFCHHLDFQRFRFPDSWHTRGFYERTATLYHYARDTAPKRLFWAPVSGGRWRIDWPRTNRGA